MWALKKWCVTKVAHCTIYHSCSCIIEFIKIVAKKAIKCSASLTFYRFSPTRLINSIKHKHSCKILYLAVLLINFGNTTLWGNLIIFYFELLPEAQAQEVMSFEGVTTYIFNFLAYSLVHRYNRIMMSINPESMIAIPRPIAVVPIVMYIWACNIFGASLTHLHFLSLKEKLKPFFFVWFSRNSLRHVMLCVLLLLF